MEPTAATVQVVILTALDVEYQAILAHLTGLSEAPHPAGTLFEVGELRQSLCRVAVGLTGSGNTNAAVVAERAIAMFHPRALFFVGISGALHDDLALGDVVFATKVYAYHGGRADDRGFHAAPDAWYPAHPLEQIAHQLARTNAWRRRLPDGDGRSLYLRPVAAGEVVLNSATHPLRDQLDRHYADAAAIEMESAGAARAGQLNRSLPTLTIRGISDRADGRKYAADAGGHQAQAMVGAAAFAAALADRVAAGPPSADPPAPAKQQNLASVGGLAVGAPPHPPDDSGGEQALSQLRRVSDAYVSDSDVVVGGDGEPIVRLSGGVYVPRERTELRLVERLAQPSVTALVGDAGNGKTAMLWRMHRLLSALGRVPVVVPASALLADPSAPATITVEIVDAALAYSRRAGQPLILLIDTLDLLLQHEDTRIMVRSLLKVAAEHRVPTLVTTRPVEARRLTIDYEDDSAPISGVRLEAFSPTEQAAAIIAYSRAFYPADRADGAATRVRDASVRGLPLRELSRNPLQLRLLFELYAPQDPPEDVDAIGLFEQYWRRRVQHDDRGPDGASGGTDLSQFAEAAGFVMLTDGNVEAEVTRLVERAAPIVASTTDEVRDGVAALRARGVLHQPRNSARTRFFHQTFFEYAAARGVARFGERTATELTARVCEDPLDLFVGEVAAQVALLAGRDTRLPMSVARIALLEWLDGDADLQSLALRTYARMSYPPDPVRDRAVDILTVCDTGAIRDYLRLLPSTPHPDFGRLRSELGVLWRRVISPSSGEAGLGFDVLRALARLAPVFPDETRVFLLDHKCLTWLLDRTRAEIRRESLHIQLLDPLSAPEPSWCADRLVEFFCKFASDGEANFEAIAEIVGLLASIAERTVLSAHVVDPVVESVHKLDGVTNAGALERQYAYLRGEMLALQRPADLLEHTRAVLEASLGRDDGPEVPARWSGRGRRAELRACAHAAAALTADEADAYLDALLTERDPGRQEGLCTILGEALSSTGGSAFTVRARWRCARELKRLPANRDADGSRPAPLLFVNSLHDADVRGTALLAALPDGVPESLWREPAGLLPLLVDAALADHSGAARVLQQMLAGEHVPSRTAFAGLVLKRLQYVAVSAAPEARAAFAHLVNHAEATAEVGQLCAVLRKSTVATVQLQPDQHTRLVALRRRLVLSGNNDEVRHGYVLWRLLIERLIDSAPKPDELARLLSAPSGAYLLTSVLEFALGCVRSSDWADRNPEALLPELEAVLATASASVAPTTTVKGRVRDRGASQRRTHEMLARQTLIAARSRLAPLPETPALRRVVVRRVFDLLLDAGYDLHNKAGLTAFAACLRELGPLVRRIPEKTTAVDLLLDTAERLHADQPEATRWRERSAREWYGAMVTTVRGASDTDRRRLVAGLLRYDRDLAGSAIRACVYHLSPPPAWLADLQAEMDAEVRDHYLSALRRQAREGGRRRLDAVYDGALGTQ